MTDLPPEPFWSVSAKAYLCPFPGCPFKDKLYYTVKHHVKLHSSDLTDPDVEQRNDSTRGS